MSEYFLSYLFKENFDFNASELIEYVNWSEEDKKKYHYPTELKIDEKDFKLLDSSRPANEIISKFYFEDNELLFLIIYTQSIIYMSQLDSIFTYNSDLEDPDFDYDPEVHEHIYMTDVEVFMIKTKNKIFVFGHSCLSNYCFEQIVLSSDGRNDSDPLAIRTFDRLGIKYKRNFQTLNKLIETKFKKL